MERPEGTGIRDSEMEAEAELRGTLCHLPVFGPDDQGLANQVEGIKAKTTEVSPASAVAVGEMVSTLSPVLTAGHTSALPACLGNRAGQGLFQGHLYPLGSALLLWLAWLSALRSGLF